MGWVFDLRTAIQLGSLVTLLTGALLLASWNSLPPAVRPSLRCWLIALLLNPLGLGLISLRSLAPDWLSIAGGNLLLGVSFACMAVALRQFYALPERRATHAVLVLLAGAVVAWFAEVMPNPQVRIAFASSMLAVLLGSSAHAVFRPGGAGGTVPRLTGAMFACVALVMVARAVHESLWPSAPGGAFLPRPLNMVVIGSLLLLPVLATVGFLLMCTQRSQEELEHTARLDYLTGIFNRRAIEDLATRAISGSRRHGIPLAILLVDVDHFKHINDQHGHEAGDQALVESVRRMRELMRSEDLVGRQGGEEFVVVLPDIDLGNAHAAAERMRRSFSDQPMRVLVGHRSVEIAVTVSIGVAALEASDLQFSHLLRRADRAMYAAKAAGRNRVMLDVGGL